jgi:hypothetical protein
MLGDGSNLPTLRVLRLDEVTRGVAFAMCHRFTGALDAPLGNSLPAWVLCDFPPDGK